MTANKETHKLTLDLISRVSELIRAIHGNEQSTDSTFPVHTKLKELDLPPLIEKLKGQLIDEEKELTHEECLAKIKDPKTREEVQKLYDLGFAHGEENKPRMWQSGSYAEGHNAGLRSFHYYQRNHPRNPDRWSP